MSKLKDLEELKKQHQKLGVEYERLGEEIKKLEEEGQAKLYDLVKFSNLEWYIIDEDDDTLTLLMKDKLSSEQCTKYFDESLLDGNKDVHFNPNYKNIWWSDSPIRMYLNSRFLENLDKSDLELMTTTVSIDGQTRTTEDYVRLLTKDEAERLPQDILKSNYNYGYWTMSPSYFDVWGGALEFRVTGAGGLIGWFDVSDGFGVRPVIRVIKGNLERVGG